MRVLVKVRVNVDVELFLEWCKYLEEYLLELIVEAGQTRQAPKVIKKEHKTIDQIEFDRVFLHLLYRELGNVMASSFSSFLVQAS